MRPLDARGKVAVAEFALYIPLVVLIAHLNFSRDGRAQARQGRMSHWFYLAIFAHRQYFSFLYF